jgi:membrane protein
MVDQAQRFSPAQHARHLLRFTLRVVRRFREHKGFLLSSAVAFNVLLSLVPLMGLVLVIMSHLADPDTLLGIVAGAVESAVPTAAPQIMGAIEAFLEQRALASGVGAGVVIFFSALAFRTTDDALSTIFETSKIKARHPVFSLALPLMVMGGVVVSLVVLSLLVTAVDMMPATSFTVFGVELSLAVAYRQVIRFVSFLGLVALLAAFYRVMPEANVRTRQAVVGGLVAAVLWEGMRRTLAWYFANVSLVGLIYGSLTTVIVLLLTIEMGAIILLLGGQVIAEIVRSDDGGVAWYDDPDPTP